MFKRIKTTSESSVDSGIGDSGTKNTDDNVTYSAAICRSQARNSYRNPLTDENITWIERKMDTKVGTLHFLTANLIDSAAQHWSKSDGEFLPGNREHRVEVNRPHSGQLKSRLCLFKGPPANGHGENRARWLLQTALACRDGALFDCVGTWTIYNWHWSARYCCRSGLQFMQIVHITIVLISSRH